MNSICDKAKDRVDKKEEEERYYELCLKYSICPKCGGDVDVSYKDRPNAISYYYHKCSECEWAIERIK